MRFLTPVALLAALPAAAQLADERPAAAPSPELHVTGIARVSVTPDEGTLFLDLEALAPSMAASMDRLAGTAGEYRAALADMGFAAGTVKTVDFAVGKHQVRRDEGYVDSGYVARQSLRVGFAYTPATLERLLAGLAAREADVEFRFAFRLSEARKDSVQEAVVREAVADGRRKAAYLAAAAGVRLVGLHRVEYPHFGYGGGGMQQVTREREYLAAAAAYDTAEALNFTPDDLLFEDTVALVYGVEPG